MNEEFPDQELQPLRAYWQQPAPERVDRAVMRAYRRHIARRAALRRYRMPTAAGVIAAAGIALWAGARIEHRLHPAQPIYVPVSEPRLVVISQGERP